MIDEKSLKEHFSWMANNDWCWEFHDEVTKPFWAAVDDDRKGLVKVLNAMDAKDLSEISGLFQDICEKWPDRKMEKTLNNLRKRIIDAG